MLSNPDCREKLNSMNLLMYMAPVAVVVLLPATLALEDNVLGITVEKARADGPGILFLLLLNSGMAYFVNLTNFLVTKHTSALTLQVSSHSGCRRFVRYFVRSTRHWLASSSLNLLARLRGARAHLFCE
jgi:hypothetical protein